MDVWKDIKGYEGYYQVSNKSMDRLVVSKIGVERRVKERILKPSKNGRGYLMVILHNRKGNMWTVHKLVAMAFLGHTPCGMELVVNHKNFNISDNRPENLEIVTNRENSNQKHLASSSKFTGVSWGKARKKWRSDIYINGKQKYLGLFTTELEASKAYQNALKNIILL